MVGLGLSSAIQSPHPLTDQPDQQKDPKGKMNPEGIDHFLTHYVGLVEANANVVAFPFDIESVPAGPVTLSGRRVLGREEHLGVKPC